MLDNHELEYRFRWINNPEQKGEFIFTFDGIRKFNLFRDYPKELTSEEKALFDSENPYWAEFFSDRT